jgi:hypothetical protein
VCNCVCVCVCVAGGAMGNPLSKQCKGMSIYGPLTRPIEVTLTFITYELIKSFSCKWKNT